MRKVLTSSSGTGTYSVSSSASHLDVTGIECSSTRGRITVRDTKTRPTSVTRHRTGQRLRYGFKKETEIIHRSGSREWDNGGRIQDRSASAPKWHSHIAYQSSRDRRRGPALLGHWVASSSDRTRLLTASQTGYQDSSRGSHSSISIRPRCGNTAAYGPPPRRARCT